MRFQPKVNQVLSVGSDRYEIAPHPMVPHLPYGQEGRMATVYKMTSENKSFALKVFKDAYRKPDILELSEKLKNYAVIPGLETCQRIVINPQEHKQLIKKESDLNYAVIMPWIEGVTWFDVLTEKTDISKDISERLAREFVRTMVSMEERKVAHCDLSAPNIILSNLDTIPRISLVDVEQLFGPTLDQPDMLLVGTPGYISEFEKSSLWSPFSDRFAGAILLAEMLSWHVEAVRESSWGDSFFNPDELQKNGDRYDVIQKSLNEAYGEDVAGLFECMWEAASIEKCPSFWEWNRVLSGESDTVEIRRTKKSDPIVMALLQHENKARDLMLEGNLSEAVAEYEIALDFARENDVSPDSYIERINELSIQQIAGYWVTDQLHDRAFDIVDLKNYDAREVSGKKFGGFRWWQLLLFVLIASSVGYAVFIEWGYQIRSIEIYQTLALQIGIASLLYTGIRRPFLGSILYFLISAVTAQAAMFSTSVHSYEYVLGVIATSAVILEIFYQIGSRLIREPVKRRFLDFLWVVMAGFISGGYIEFVIISDRLSSFEKIIFNLVLAAVGWILGNLLASLIINLRERT